MFIYVLDRKEKKENMKFLKGGLILLNICSLSLALDGSAQSITDKETLEQLSELQSYLTDDQSLPPKKGLKTVVVQYYSGDNELSGIMTCSVIQDGFSLIITGCDGKITLRIECYFGLNEEEIPMTKYVLTGVDVFSYHGIYADYTVEIDSNLKVDDDLTLNGDLKVDGTITKKVGSSYVEIPTKNIYQHLIVLKGTNALVVLKLICNEEHPMTSKTDVISLINEIFSDQDYSSSKPMTIDCNGWFITSNYTVSIIQLSFNGLLCTYETVKEGFGTETVVDTTTIFDKLGQIDTVTDTVYRLN